MPKPEYKQRLKAWKTHGFLKAETPFSNKELEKLQSFSVVELAAAARNSDHSEEGRKAAADRLQLMGGKLSDADIVVPGFVRFKDRDRLRKKFFGISRIIRVWAGWLSFLWFACAFVAIGYSSELETDALIEAKDAGIISSEDFFNSDRELTDEEFAEAYATGSMRIDAFQSQNALRDWLLVKAEVTPTGKKMKFYEEVGFVFIALLMVSVLLWFLFAVFRGQPARILLLRKFNDKKVSKPLRHVISSQIAPFGHTTTLSDKFFKKSAWSWLWDLIPKHWALIPVIPVWMLVRVVMRQFNRAKWGPVWVGSARNYRHLAKRLRDKIPLNFIVSCSSNKEAFMVRTHDDWWQEVIKMIMNSSDVIVVDLSNVTAGTEWELKRLDDTDMWTRAIFIAHEETISKALLSIAPYSWSEKVRLYSYDSVGDFEGLDKKQFREDMLIKIGQTAQSYS